MGPANLGFGKTAPLLPLICKSLRETFPEELDTGGKSKVHFILYLTFPPEDITSMIISQASDWNQSQDNLRMAT